MYIVIKKKVNSNQWDYPGSVSDFKSLHLNPDNPQELIVENKSTKTIEELNIIVTYTIVEYLEPIYSTGIRTITKRSFLRRFTQVERTAIRKSIDDIVIDIHEDLKLSSNVNLDLKDTKDALSYLVLSGILEASRPSELLVDGTPEEEYKGA